MYGFGFRAELPAQRETPCQAFVLKNGRETLHFIAIARSVDQSGGRALEEATKSGAGDV